VLFQDVFSDIIITIMSGKYYSKSISTVLDALKVKQKKGLTGAQATARLARDGPNSLQQSEGINPLKLLIGQFKDVLVLILLAAAAISFAISILDDHSLVEPLLIFGIVIAIAIIGFFNELKAEKTVESLRNLLSDTATVRRNGKVAEVEVSELVAGDIVLLSEGTKISADMRILNAKRLMVNESSLTGESVPVEKITTVLKGDRALGDQRNMAFSGTFVASGSAECVVTGTGSNSEIGRIAQLVDEVDESQTPLQRKLDELGRRIGLVVLLLCVAVFVIIYLFNDDIADESTLQRLLLAFTAAVALAVAAIPEGLAFVVRIALAIGARVMASQKALVRKLSAVEALGSTDVICTDKTGTLTKGEMVAVKLWTAAGTANLDSRSDAITSGNLQKLLNTASYASDAHFDDSKSRYVGDPTEIAMVQAADELISSRKKLKRVDEVPFSSSRKMMSTVLKDDGGYLVASKGAVDVLLGKCTYYVDEKGRKKKLDGAAKKRISAAQKRFGGQALRVLGVATKSSSKKITDTAIEKELTFIGMICLFDPPRQEVREVMDRVQQEAGMRVIMITGDHIDTASAVAKEIGIDGDALSGVQIDAMTDAAFRRAVKKTSVFARVNPEHKLRIVQALQAHGLQVAMTGDGVNDAPAIKAADIGIAMGVTGTDAAKESADLILLDDRFVTIISAIKSGRGIYDNVRKFVNYLLSANIAEVISVLGGILLFNSLILTASQLLFINIVTDGLPAIALGSDPAEKDIMSSSPKRFKKAIITKKLWSEMLLYGAIMSAIILAHYYYIDSSEGDQDRAISVAFASMVVYELVRLIGIRSNYHISWRSNPWLLISMAGSMAILLVVLYVEPVANVFGVTGLGLIDWLILAAGS